ncbi:hypothetical protein Nepgr_031846 [Nepenthes gracilis]|uniref:HRDC domain-containing protein n=1 Tax=Nepenthes gracilis TaxID=150966 RepID=A0AAD3THH6_NEPGR|nr:hypothetical protein Nepgr_031846 [Nepenthes gracilis]
MIQNEGPTKHLWGREIVFPEDSGYYGVFSVDDELFERFDRLADTFSGIRKSEEDGAKGMISDENVFRFVSSKNEKTGGVDEMKVKEETMVSSAVRSAERDNSGAWPKSKVTFHIPTIRRPQEEFNILVNNSNQPFEHVWLEWSEDDLMFIHPLEKLSVLDFVDRKIEDIEPLKPPPVESTPFKLVDEVKDLKQLAAKLRSVNEFSVDLEHNQYRSFQGLTCLMQISTRTEDFVIDTLKLRIHIGPYLRDIFKDPKKRKVMHGADRDILWLQRDFGIYVCNLFDTGQASRMLKMERNSLEYLLHHFCGVTANKVYQSADWRLRPLPDEMLRYAREDTHYLLFIYDLMRVRLLSESAKYEESDTLLVEVYERSYDLCMQLYEKELLTDISYLYIYGLQGANFNAQQLSVVSGLYEWRDIVARAEDESTGYILPNKTLLEIAKQMPITISDLQQLVGSKHPYVDRNLASIVNIIRHSIQNVAAFEAVVKQLKERHIELAPQLNVVGAERSKAYTKISTVDSNAFDSIKYRNVPVLVHFKEAISNKNGHKETFQEFDRNEYIRKHINGSNIHEDPRQNLIFTRQRSEMNENWLHSKKAEEETVRVLKKAGLSFGAFMGSSASEKTTDYSKKVGLPFEAVMGSSASKKIIHCSNKGEDEMKSEPADLSMKYPISLGSDRESTIKTSCRKPLSDLWH